MRAAVLFLIALPAFATNAATVSAYMSMAASASTVGEKLAHPKVAVRDFRKTWHHVFHREPKPQPVPMTGAKQ